MLPRVCWGMYGCRLVAFNNGFYLVDNLLATLAAHLGIFCMLFILGLYP